MGLLLSHNCTVRVWRDLVTVSRDTEGKPPGGGKRSEIEGFTDESRKRLIEFMHTLKFDGMTMVTLTYPEDYPEDWKIYKKHLRAYRSHLDRTYGKLRIVWRLEYQKRGAPHFHLLVLDPPFIPASEESKKWAKITRSGDLNHAKIGVDVSPVTEWGDRGLAAFYVAKYAGKSTGLVEEKDHGKTGRHWGYWNIEKESPSSFTLALGDAEYLSTFLFASRGSADTWRPVDYTRATILGDSLGSDKFGQRALLLARLLGKQKEPRNA